MMIACSASRTKTVFPRVLCLLGGMYVLFSVARHFRVQHLVTAVPGWEKLSECSPVGSFDGSKTLSFSADRTVALLDMRDRKNRSLAESKGARCPLSARDIFHHSPEVQSPCV